KIKDEAQLMGHEPLYSRLDMNGLLRLIRGVEYAKPVKLNESVYVTFHEVSHILGAASIAVSVHEGSKRQKVLFSGDIGNPPTLMLNPIDYVFDADYAVVESAYGNRFHENRAERRDLLLKVIKETVERNGILMIPSFALERTQELLLEFDTLFEKGSLPKVPIFVDSPLATRISHVYGRYSHYFNEAALALLKNNKGLLQFPWLAYTSTTPESKRINDIPGSKIIIAGSGMSQGGRILHHERRYLPDSKNTILFIGYQVNGSLGRKILDGQKQISIFGEPVSVNCSVESISSYSAHADQTGLLEYVEKANSARRLKKVFVVQGEEEGAQVLGELIREKLGIDAIIPNMHETFDL
ncbi:MAG: MBL fold metallo-hydrolase, partial [Candidatus Yanofskybacteria bacterium]|nr:MBL fold metallo-hydrolase [Candidatus Yanofskybacteria bacterium]